MLNNTVSFPGSDRDHNGLVSPQPDVSTLVVRACFPGPKYSVMVAANGG